MNWRSSTGKVVGKGTPRHLVNIRCLLQMVFPAAIREEPRAGRALGLMHDSRARQQCRSASCVPELLRLVERIQLQKLARLASLIGSLLLSTAARA